MAYINKQQYGSSATEYDLHDARLTDALSGIVKSDGVGGIAAAVAGTDYQSPLTAGTDYATPASVSAKYTKPDSGIPDSDIASASTWNGKQNAAVSSTGTLTTTWTENEQTISVTGVTTTNTVIVSPAPASASAYASAGIVCAEQLSGQLRFTCTTVPTTAITVNVVIL